MELWRCPLGNPLARSKAVRHADRRASDPAGAAREADHLERANVRVPARPGALPADAPVLGNRPAAEAPHRDDHVALGRRSRRCQSRH